MLEEDGPESRRLKKLDKKIADLEADLEDLHDELAAASALELKRPKVERVSLG